MNAALLERLKLTPESVDNCIPVDTQSLQLGHLWCKCPNLSLPELMLARLWVELVMMVLICVPDP